MSKNKSSKKINHAIARKNILRAGWVSFLHDTSGEMVTPVFPIFLSSVLGVDKTFIGVIEGISKLTISFVRIGSGWLSDNLGKRKVFMLFGYGLSTLARVGLAFIAGPLSALLVRFGDFFGKGLRDSARDAFIADSSIRETRGWAFGYHRTMDTLGTVLGAVVASLLLFYLVDSDLKFRAIFLFSVVPALFSFLILAFAIRERKIHPVRFAIWDIRGMGVNFWIFLALTVLFSTGQFSEAFLILRAQELGVKLPIIPMTYLIIGITYSVLAVPIGVYSDRVGRRRLVASGWMVYVVSLIILALSKSIGWMLLAFALYGVFNAFCVGVSRALVGDLVAPAKRATAYGIYNATTGLALLFASIAAGVLWERWGSSATFFFGAILAAVAFVGLVIFRLIRPRVGQ